MYVLASCARISFRLGCGGYCLAPCWITNDAVLNVGVIQDRMTGRTIMQGDIDKVGQEAAISIVLKYITRMHGVTTLQSRPSGSQISLT
jgi:hypothetical protein